MSLEFYAEPNPSKEFCEEVVALSPANPFYTFAYIESKRSLGFQPWIFALCHEGQLVSACTAFIKSSYLTRTLDIHSLPIVSDGNTFWEGLLRFCSKARVSHLEANSFASKSVSIPNLPSEIGRRVRLEYLLELQKPGFWDDLSSNHLRNIKRARKTGLQMRRAVDAEACIEHARLVRASMGRRKSRGESVTGNIHVRTYIALVQSGAGELFQAILDGKVMSSILVLMAKQGGYYQSAGTSPEGMVCGASHFLVYEIANTLQAQSLELFNLGGADHLSPGLERFKAGFDAKIVKLEAAKFFLGSKITEKLRTTIWLLSDTPVRFLRHMQR